MINQRICWYPIFKQTHWALQWTITNSWRKFIYQRSEFPFLGHICRGSYIVVSFDLFCFLIASLNRFKCFSCKVSNWGTVPCIPDPTMIGLYQLYPSISISKANSEYNYRSHNQDSLGAYTAYRLIAIRGPTFAGILSHPPNLLGFQIGSLEGVSFASHPAKCFHPTEGPLRSQWNCGEVGHF